MIQISIDGKNLDIPRDTAIPMEEAFGFDEFLNVPGEKSWRFTIPKTPANRLAFGLADDPMVVWDSAVSYSCAIYVDGHLFKRGRLFLEEDDELNFDAYFIGTTGELKDKFLGIKLNEMPWPTINYGAGAFFAWADAAVSNPNIPVAFFRVLMRDLPQAMYNNYNPNYQSTLQWEGFVTVNNIMVPYPKLNYLWTMIRNDYKVGLKSDFLEDAEINNLVFFNTIPVNEKDANGFTSSFPAGFEVAKHVPDIELETFLVEFAKLFNLFIFYDGETNQMSIIPRKSFLNNRRVIWTDIVAKLKIMYERNKTYSLRYDYKEEEIVGTGIWAGSLAGINGPTGSEVIEIEISTLPMWRNGGPSATLYMPTTIYKPEDRHGVKLLFYRGFVDTSPAVMTEPALPFGSSDISESPGFNYTLLWKGTGGLYETWWKPYLERLYPARVLKLEVRMKTNELREFDRTAVHVIDGMKCLVRKMEYDLQDDETIVEMELIKF